MHLTHRLHSLHVPVFHPFQSPHLEWHEVVHPLGVAAVTLAVVASLAVAGLALETATVALARASAPAAPPPDWEPRPLEREWRWSQPSVNARSMFPHGYETPASTYPMWRKR